MLSDYQRLVEKPKIESCERRLRAAQAALEAKDREIERLREALMRAGRAVGCALSDSVSTEFLVLVPSEVEAVARRLRS